MPTRSWQPLERNNMNGERGKTWPLILAAALLLVACQKPTIQYVKYSSDADVPRISAQDAKKEVEAGNAILVDGRGDAAFKAEHLPGAISIPYNAEDRFDQLPKGKKIIIYCT